MQILKIEFFYYYYFGPLSKPENGLISRSTIPFPYFLGNQTGISIKKRKRKNKENT